MTETLANGIRVTGDLAALRAKLAPPEPPPLPHAEEEAIILHLLTGDE